MSVRRNIFEEVSGHSQNEPQKTNVIEQGRSQARTAIRYWLICLFLLVTIMILIGGLTRLTDSGLSITEWELFSGILPPLSEGEWVVAFERYKQIDEWRLQKSWMQLDDFKIIYWWEWGHRQFGRIIGFVWAIGFSWFFLRGRIPVGWTARLLLIGGLGGVQGFVGWWMVMSGVNPGTGLLDVASYRLSIHLGLAFLVLGFISWYIFLLTREERELIQARRIKEKKQFGLATGLLYFLFLQIMVGALVAGIDAGQTYNDWPLMGGQFFPVDAFIFEPVWRNFFENPGLVQFIHRVLGYVLSVFGFIVWIFGGKSAHQRTRTAFNMVLLVLILQVVLGIVTVLYAAPWQIAIFHQLLAILLWVSILYARFLSAYPIAIAIKNQ
ncbi:MAG: COX15/CtaA family protein [Aestuariivita sp.]|nr:COX15/CtaA family protein [Aestuariivita sp.]